MVVTKTSFNYFGLAKSRYGLLMRNADGLLVNSFRSEVADAAWVPVAVTSDKVYHAVIADENTIYTFTDSIVNSKTRIERMAIRRVNGEWVPDEELTYFISNTNIAIKWYGRYAVQQGYGVPVKIIDLMTLTALPDFDLNQKKSGTIFNASSADGSLLTYYYRSKTNFIVGVYHPITQSDEEFSLPLDYTVSVDSGIVNQSNPIFCNGFIVGLYSMTTYQSDGIYFFNTASGVLTKVFSNGNAWRFFDHKDGGGAWYYKTTDEITMEIVTVDHQDHVNRYPTAKTSNAVIFDDYAMIGIKKHKLIPGESLGQPEPGANIDTQPHFTNLGGYFPALNNKVMLDYLQSTGRLLIYEHVSRL